MNSTVPGILVIHGPNLNLLGQREPGLYGSTTLETIDRQLHADAAALGLTIECWQSNHEGAIVDKIHEYAAKSGKFVIINAGAYTHTSIAIRDAFLAVQMPFVEVHLSNVYRREHFRHQSLLADTAIGVIAGLGAEGYRYALRFAATPAAHKI
ncbi:MAG: type II 3-dehydroquinate dehydratase [Burkholderiaceae bacterium]